MYIYNRYDNTRIPVLEVFDGFLQSPDLLIRRSHDLDKTRLFHAPFIE